MEIGSARFRAAEILFRPEIIGEEWPGIATALDLSIRVSFHFIKNFIFFLLTISRFFILWLLD